jgi:hypothetical protein
LKFGDGEVWKNQLEGWCEKYKYIIQSQEKMKHPKHNKTKEYWTGHFLRRNRLPNHIIEA